MSEKVVKRLLQEPEMKLYVGLGRNRAREFCESIGATVRIGRRVLYDKTVIDAALDAMRESSKA